MIISIITAVLNRSYCIAHAVDSVKKQTYNSIEHIIVDGGSTDGTFEIAANSIDNRAILVSEPDEGIYDALNKGLELARGEVIGILHSDDFYADDTVLAQVATIFQNPSMDAVYGDLEYVTRENTERVVRYWRAGPYDSSRLAWGWMPPHPTLFLRRRIIERWGGFDTRFRISADYDAVLRYFGHDKLCVHYIPHVLVKMRVGGVSNRSLGNILIKMREDYVALRRNNIGGAGALLWKNLSKVLQFLYKPKEQDKK